ncbi:MAG: Uma2 family endonuclease [Rhizobiaceae bacterium]|nr:Uma2 family endonuclease [Rhizobiaceae bacterium]MCV0406440.1 Uma2 family endonuclease [Rhizobiaceae bacterium]
MAEQGKRRATYADIEAAPEHLVAEIIDGELLTHPRPSPRHSGTANAVSAKLTDPFQWGGSGPGGWVFFVEPELKIGQNIVVPDVAGWRRERLAGYPETNFFDVVPDWVCEILSASTERRDRGVKKRVYAMGDVAYLWLIDPRLQMLEAFELRDGSWMDVGTWNSADEVRAPPFHAISFSLADLWPLDPPLGMNEDPTPYYAGDR